MNRPWSTALGKLAWENGGLILMVIMAVILWWMVLFPPKTEGSLTTLRWDPSPDPDVTHYTVYSKHLRPVWTTCVGDDGVARPCVDRYITVSQVGPFEVPATLPCCAASLEMPLTSELMVGDVQFFKLSAVRAGGCSSRTAFPPL